MEPETSQNTRQTQFLLTSFVIIVVIILTLVVILASYPTLLAPPPTTTPTITLTRTPSLTPSSTAPFTYTPTITRTPRPTLSPTITRTPTRTLTPTITPTPPGPPTLTPAAPVIGAANYSLNNWTPERAAEMVDLLVDYPNTLPRQSRGADDASYNAAYQYSVLAIKESLLRFPDAVQAQKWRVQLAFSMAHMGNAAASATYADLIVNGLNSARTDLDNLQTWFKQDEPRFNLRLTDIKAPTGYLNAHLIEIEAQGSAFILLLESSSAYLAYPLISQFNFNLQPPPQSTATPQVEYEPIPQDYIAITADLTGDGLPEIIIYNRTPDQTRLAYPFVYSYDQLPPQQLRFNPTEAFFDIGMSYQNRWSRVAIGGESQLRFSTRIFPPCPIDIERTYVWDQNYLTLSTASLQPDPSSAMLSYCRYMVDHAANLWGPSEAISIMQPILPDWPPSSMEDGKPFPLDARDEWRFKLGVYNALIGDQQSSLEIMQALVSSPALPASRYIIPARKFIDIYKTTADVYRACLTATPCDPALALGFLIRSLDADQFKDVISYLSQHGVALRSYGYFDFDGDDVRDIWFTVRHHDGEKLEFWFLIPYRENIAYITLDTEDVKIPQLEYYDETISPPIVLVNGVSAFQVMRTVQSRQPFIQIFDLPKEYPNRYKNALESAKANLFSGIDPVTVHAQLAEIETSPGLLCQASWTCDEYYYLLGLASELAGDKLATISSYLRLWWDYSKSPFTTMARLKLHQFTTPTTTPTQTFTPTLSPTGATATVPIPTAAFATFTPTTTTGVQPGATPTRTPRPTSDTYPGPSNATQNPYP